MSYGTGEESVSLCRINMLNKMVDLNVFTPWKLEKLKYNAYACDLLKANKFIV